MTKRVLVIDDEKPIRDSFVLALEDTEFQVDTASSGKEGLEKIRGGVYGLIYLDLKMPGMNGVETLRKIREMDPTIPIYIITAFAKQFFDELCRLKEENIEFEIMRKPIGMNAIKEITASLLNDVVSGY